MAVGESRTPMPGISDAPPDTAASTTVIAQSATAVSGGFGNSASRGSSLSVIVAALHCSILSRLVVCPRRVRRAEQFRLDGACGQRLGVLGVDDWMPKLGLHIPPRCAAHTARPPGVVRQFTHAL